MFDSEPVPEVKLVRLHADADGVLWYGHDHTPFDSTGRLAVEFHHNPASFDVGLDRAKTVRLLGTADNAQVVIGLRKFHHDNPKLAAKQAVMLGSPLVCPSRVLRANPECVLQAMWQPGATSVASGCWHAMGPREYVTYAIVTELKATRGQPSELARRSLRYHPAWPALSFLSGLDEDAACRLVAAVIEPRWFRHPFRPTRLSRLNSYLGLNPGNMAAFVSGGDGGRNYGRAKTVLDTWAVGFRHSMSGSGGFLHRVAELAPEGQYHLGLLKACERFVRFLFEVWTAESASDHEAKFEPGLFFKRPDEVAGYAAHRRNLRV